HTRIPGVESARDVRACDQLEQRCVVCHLPHTETVADVRVEVHALLLRFADCSTIPQAVWAVKQLPCRERRGVAGGDAPRPACEAGVPARTVRTALSSSTPWDAHGVRSPCAGAATPRSSASSL